MSALSINTKTKGVNVNINSSDSGNDCEALSVPLERKSLYILSLNYGLMNIKNKSQNTFEKDPTLCSSLTEHW